ncbi:MAG: Gfo/Idh/MocA family oxidoreductase [Treponema sp.]|nr:Gfo/Idh/MocA family oxidoreductase [Treponema sp.]
MYRSVFTDELYMDAAAALPIIKSWDCEYADFRGMINGKGIEFQTDAELKALKAQMDGLGLKTGVLQSSLCKVHLPDRERQQKELERLEGLIRASKILGCSLVRSFFYWQPEEVDESLFGQLAVRPDLMTGVLEMFAPIKKRALEAGLIIGFENCGITCDEVIAFCNALNVPQWGLAWDVSNDLYLNPQAQWSAHFVKCIKRTVLVHVKAVSIIKDIGDDPVKNSKEPIVPWNRVLRGITASHKDLPVSIETHNPQGSKFTHEEATKRSFDLIRDAWPSGAPGGSIEEAVSAAAQFDFPPCPFKDNPVRFVVVGMGMGKFRAQQLTENPAVKLVGVCDINAEKAKAAGVQFGVKYSDDINVFLKDPEVEVMYVVIPTGLHCEVAEQCLKAGKHVLTTKPMDVSLEACDRAIAVAKEKGLLFGVDYDMRHTSQMMELVQAQRKGYFGRILSANVNLYVSRDQKYYDENGAWRGTFRYDGGGAMSNQGVHEVDRMLEVLGMPKKVRAGMARQTHFIEAEDIGWSEWDYGTGLVVRYASTTSYPIPTWYARIEIHGTDGAYIYTSGGPEGEHAWWSKRDGAWTETAPYAFKRRWRCGSDNFANSVRTGEPLSISAEVGRKARAILDAIYKSARGNGGWQDVVW